CLAYETSVPMLPPFPTRRSSELGEPTRRLTVCFSMYSDMSSWMRAFSSPNRNSVRALAVSVLPTPEGPRKMNEPAGRRGSLRPRSEEHTSELQSRENLVCRLLLE